MLHRRISLLALLLSPAVAPAFACGSSNSGNPAGAGDSGSSSDVSVEDSGSTDTGSPQDTGAPTDSGTEAASDGGILGANCPAVDAGTFVQATHSPLPTMANFGGPVLPAPQIVTFTFSNTANAAALQAFGATITQTPWFTDVTRDYCIHDGGTCITAGPTGLSVDITTAAAASYTDTFGQGDAGAADLEQFINQQISAAVAASAIPAPGPSSLYVFYFPSTTSIVSDGAGMNGGTSCSSFSGYHSNMTYTDGTTPIVYAIIPDCAGSRPTRELSSMTTAASHEIAEATTDPHVNTEPTWYLDQPIGITDAAISVPQFRNDPWATTFTYGEVGDNCERLPARTWTLDAGPPGGDAGYIVQRIWSMSAAAAGHNPCVPVPAGETYYNASTDKAIYVANVGDTFTVDVTAFSEVARPSWRLDALDYTPTQMTDSSGNAKQYLKLEFVGGVTGSDGVSSLLCVNNGSTGQVKVTLLADPAADSSLSGYEWPEADGTILSADVANATTRTTADGGVRVSFPYQLWPFAVITPATATSLGVTSAGIQERTLATLRAAHRVHASRFLPPEP